MKLYCDKTKKIGVAVSGGADSMVMLALLQESGADIVAINIDHSIRGEESERDSNFVKEYCNSHEIPLLFFKIDAIDCAKKNKLSLELSAREERYRIFDKLLADKQVDLIMLAHHLDDQFETMLLRFMRGTGVRGLRGIVDREGYCHPLINYSKQEIIEYANAQGIPYVEDSTNKDTDYRRNFFRHSVIPKIKNVYPDVLNVISKSSRIFAELEDYLLSEITPCKVGKDYVELPLSVLDRHVAIAKKSVTEAIRKLGVTKDIEYNHLESIIGLKDKQSNTSLDFPFGLQVVREYQTLKIYKKQQENDYRKAFDLNEKYVFRDIEYSFEKTDNMIKGITFDGDKIPNNAEVRTRKKGDSFLRVNGFRKTLSDYLTDKKIPKSERDKLLVIAKDNEVFVILGYEVSDKVKIDNNTKNKIKVIIGG